MGAWVRVLLASACALSMLGVCRAAADQAAPVTVNLQMNDVRVAADGSSLQSVHAEVHANNDAGAIQLNQVQLPYDSADQDVKIDEAYTLKADGTKIPIDMNAVYVSLPNAESQQGEITDQRLKVMVFPQVAAGDTIVYSAKFTNSVAVFPRTFTYGMAFNPTVPLKEERDTITAPKALGLRTETHGVEFASQDAGDNVVYRWHYSSATPTAMSLAEVSPIDQLPRFFVSNFKDYNELGRAFGAIMSTKLQVTPKVAALAETLTAGESDPREQIRKLYEWVNTNIRYIAIELGSGTMVPHDVDAILTYGYGDCKDHDLLLRALLKAKGIASEDVLLNSSNAYTLTQVPTFVQLNHVITYVPSLKLYLDSSALGTPFGVLPYPEYGKPSIHVAGTTAALGTMPVLPPGMATETTTNVMHMSSSGVITGSVTTSAQGPSQMLLRLVGLALQAVGSDKIAAQQLSARGYVGAMGTLRADPPMVRGANYAITGQYTIPGWSEWLSGRKVSFMPIGLRILGVAGDGPMGSFISLKSNTLNPTPCFSVRQIEDDSLELPASAHFLAVPADSQVTTGNILFTAHWSLSGNTLSVHREFTSTISQPLCTGTIRRQSALALLQMVVSYLTPVRIGPQTQALPPVAQNAAAPPLNPSALGETGPDDIVSVARLGDTDRALHELDTLMASNRADGPNSYSAHLAQGIDDLRSNELPRAISELSEAIRLNPGSGSQPYTARASAYLQLNRNRLALADLDVALKSDPDNIRLREMHADALVQLRDYDNAARDYNVIVRADPADRAVILRRADIRYHAEKYEEAAADYRRAATLGAAQADVRPGLCGSLARTDAFAQALDHCEWTLQHAGPSGPTLESYGYALFRLGKFADALKQFDQAVRSYPDMVKYLYERGIVELKLNNAAARTDVAAATRELPDVAKKVPAELVP